MQLGVYTDKCRSRTMVCVLDPDDAFPDYRREARSRIEEQRNRLKKANVAYTQKSMPLRASEDELLALVEDVLHSTSAATVVVDITSFPKRYFCLLVKELLGSAVRNVIVTYAAAGPGGYTGLHLAEDPLPADHLPGFVAELPPRGDTLVLCIGFEPLRLRSLMKEVAKRRKGIRIVLPFPPDGVFTRRCWDTLFQITEGHVEEIRRDDIEVVATWDAEQVYRTLKFWDSASNGLTLAPFGPKPLTLGMTLFAIEHKAGLYYTQPKAYNPNYSSGVSDIWAYVVKWGGVPCYSRAGEKY